MRPRELDDETWLRDRYGRTGDAQIASELGCSRETVALARRRLGIAPRPRGRPRGSAPDVEIQLLRPAAELVAERIARELSDSRAGAGPAVVALRIKAVQRALAAGDQLGLEDAVTSTAAALGVWLDQLQRRHSAAEAAERDAALVTIS